MFVDNIFKKSRAHLFAYIYMFIVNSTIWMHLMDAD